MESGGQSGEDTAPPRRRPATAAETRAIGHPLRVRILTLCRDSALTNRQLADRLGRDPGTVLHHVRRLLDAGLLEQTGTRTGASGALEKPYRTAVHTWWLDGPLESLDPQRRLAPVVAFTQELDEAGPESVREYAKFQLHLDDDDVAQLDREILEVLDRWVRTEGERAGRPRHGGLYLVHRSSDGPPPSPIADPSG